MSKRKIPFVPGEYYHLYNRGNDKRVIFHDEQDYKRFLVLLFLCNSRNKVDMSELQEDLFSVARGNAFVAIGAYCLMPNHFHILVTPLEEKGVSTFMQKITTAYSMYYNSKYSRTGSLFEGKFKSEHADTDRYLKYLFSYIHLNPVSLLDKEWKKRGINNKAEVLDFLNTYHYSSFSEYQCKKRKESAIVNKGPFPDYFPASLSFVKEILLWISYIDVPEGLAFR